MKIFFIAPQPINDQSTNFRIKQYFPYLDRENIAYCFSPFIDEEFKKIIYQNGLTFKKTSHFIKSTCRRLADILKIKKSDVIFIQREAFPLGPAFFEWLFSRSSKVVFDFDDAIFLPSASKVNKITNFLKYPSRVKDIIKMSKHIIAGNSYLQEYALNYNNQVTIIPTPIDIDEYFVKQQENTNPEILIGWIGSHSTVGFLAPLEEVFQQLASRYPLKVKIISSKFIPLKGVNVINHLWNYETVVKDLQELDIGIMPLPDNDFTKGKCAFKAIQYMALGIPTICSQVGMNKEVIQDGVNGFLADSTEEWVKKLSLLIEDKILRKNLGLKGRQTVEEKYSVKVNAPKVIDIIKKVHESR